MRAINWTEVTESTGGSTMLEPGGYVIKITDIHDMPENECLEIVFDVAEGEKAGVYAGVTDDWKHSFRQYYTERARGMFKAFYRSIEKSNPGFTWGGTDEREFIGKIVGVVVGKEYYTTRDGEDKEKTKPQFAIAADDVRSGKFKIPEPYDNRRDKSFPFGQQKSGGAYSATGAKVDDYSDIPFM